MGKILSKQMIEEIRAQNDIVEVIGSYLQLKRAGGTFKTLCPFHKEKTPSFNVNSQRQIYHCFGCGAGGDVFRFVMEYEGVDFGMAARMLAERVGIHLEYSEGDSEKSSEKDVLYRIHEDAALLFNRILLEMSNAEQARHYLKEREIDEETVKSFLIGYAPERRDTMRQLSEKKGYTPAQLEKAGLIARSSQGDYYDRFRQRLMIPIRDQLGRVIAFTGRVIDASQKGGKYVNSPETILFQKSQVLFGFDRARRAIVDERSAIVCEGQIDAIRCHQAGIQNVVASQGTALTEQHARLLKRYADSVVLVLDPDKAGEDAAIRSAEFFLATGIELKVASLPEGEDPDTLVRKQGAEGFLDFVNKALNIIDFQVGVLKKREDLGQEAALMRAVRAVISTISHTPSAVQRDQLLSQAAERLGIREEALRQDMQSMARRQQPRRAETSEEPERPAAAHPPEEMTLIELLLVHGEVAPLVESYLPPEYLADPVCRKLLDSVLEHIEDEEWRLVESVADDDDCVKLAAKLQFAPRAVESDDISPAHAAQDIILKIRRKRLEEKRQGIRARIDAAPDDQTRDRLRLESHQLALDINTLRQGWQHALPLLELDAR